MKVYEPATVQRIDEDLTQIRLDETEYIIIKLLKFSFDCAHRVKSIQIGLIKRNGKNNR